MNIDVSGVLSKAARKVRDGLWQIACLGLPQGTHITRYAMYERLAGVGARLPHRSGRVLSISHSAELCERLGLRPTEVVGADYPEHDLTSLRFPDESFEFVLSDQVLEHVEGDVQLAIDESWRVLRPGGIAVHTTCFINPVHGAPGDFWRFTPAALRLLCRGFRDVIECSGWGNFEAWLLIRSGFRWKGIPHAGWHPLHRLATRNDPRWPISTWVVARK